MEIDEKLKYLSSQFFVGSKLNHKQQRGTQNKILIFKENRYKKGHTMDVQPFYRDKI